MLAIIEAGRGALARQPVERGPRLEVLLDERDHIRIKLTLVDDHDADGETFELRQRLLKLEKEITLYWNRAEPEVAPEE